MRILVDFDQTIAASSEVVYNICKEEFNLDKDYDKTHDWDFVGLLPNKYLGRALELFDEPELYSRLKPFDNAVDVLTKLSEKHEIMVVSKHTGIGKNYKTAWLREHLPFVKTYFTETFDKSEVSGDIIIDDKLECLYSLKPTVKHCLCFGNYQWNKDWDGIRCSNWLDVLAYIESINKSV